MKSKMNIKSIVIMAAVCIVSLFFINMSLAANTAKVSVQTANLRETADENSKILELLSIDQEVEIVEKVENWYKVKVSGITGYLREDVITVNGEVAQAENTTNNDVQTTQKQVESTPVENTDTELGKKIVSENTKLKIVPIINATDIIEVKKDEEVNVVEIVNNWACVETKTAKGWIRKEKLQKPEEKQAEVQAPVVEEPVAPTEPQVQVVNKTLYVKESSVNMRKEANTTSEVVATLTVNTAVNVVEESNGWSKAKVNDKEGYILSSLLATQKQETSRSQTTPRQATTNQETQVATQQSSVAAPGKGATVIETARQYLGYRYVWGGSSPSTGFDCSGFTSYIYGLHGVSLSRTAAAQAGNGVAVDRSNLQAGDLVFFGNGGISHVGIYIGGGSFIHAANSNKGVIISTLSSGYYNSNYVCARRVM